MIAVSCFYFNIEKSNDLITYFNPIPFCSYVKSIIVNTLHKGVVCKLHLLRHLICFMKKLSFR